MTKTIPMTFRNNTDLLGMLAVLILTVVAFFVVASLTNILYFWVFGIVSALALVGTLVHMIVGALRS